MMDGRLVTSEQHSFPFKNDRFVNDGTSSRLNPPLAQALPLKSKNPSVQRNEAVAGRKRRFPENPDAPAEM